MPESTNVSPGTLAPLLAHVLDEVRRSISKKYGQVQIHRKSVDLPSEIFEASKRLGVSLSSFEKDEVLSHLENEWNPFGILQPLIDDPKVSDIIISSANRISIQQGRKNIRTQIKFPDQRSYEAFVERLLQRAGASYSTKQPIADGMVGSLVRVHAVHRCLCDGGPYVTLRINRFTSVTLMDLVGAGLAPTQVVDYLRAIVGIGRTILLVGEVGTGKTTLSRALAATIPEDESILVIEDTPEIRLDHPHVRYITTRDENIEGVGRVTPAQCIRAGMRMAMNRIIFGEIRDAEAAEAFVDVCASGHAGLSTVHGRSAADAVTRLELFLSRAQRSADKVLLSAQVATAVQVIVVVDVCRHSGIRRIMEVREIGPVADGVLRYRDIFSYRYADGQPHWIISSRVSACKELLERDPFRYKLTSLPDRLELPLDVYYREAAVSLVR